MSVWIEVLLLKVIVVLLVAVSSTISSHTLPLTPSILPVCWGIPSSKRVLDSISFMASSPEVTSTCLHKPQEILGLSLPHLNDGKLKKQKKAKQLVWIIYKSSFYFP